MAIDHYDSVVVGAGFGGIRALWELRRLGLTARCFELGSDVGGTWYWNRYPGARTDSEAWVYAMNFAPELAEEWDFKERYPGQDSVQRNLSKVVDRYDLRKEIAFNTRISSAIYNKHNATWSISTSDGLTVTCRYFIPATGPLSVARDLPFPGVKTFKGEYYQAAKWPKQPVDLRGKRVAMIGTGATGVQIIPKIAPLVKQLTVFQRTPNYVLPGRNYHIDEDQAAEIKRDFQEAWGRATKHGFGLAMTEPNLNAKDIESADTIRQVLDCGWESGGFHFQFETFSDLFTDAKSNKIASDYLCNKIRAVVRDQKTAETLCPNYPFLSKRPPCGHYYYETFNRPNVKLVDISKDDIDIYEDGVRTKSGDDYEFDVLIFAIGFDAATGALCEMDVKGQDGVLLRDHWASKLDTFAGVLVPGFPNMFMVCGPHAPFGNMPVVEEVEVGWIGQTMEYMERTGVKTIDVPSDLADAWSDHVTEAFEATLFAESSEKVHAWFVGANVEGKPRRVLFYFGGVPTWNAWLEKQSQTNWSGMILDGAAPTNGHVNGNLKSNGDVKTNGDIQTIATGVKA